MARPKTFFVIIQTIVFLFFLQGLSYPFDKIITVPAEDPADITVELPAGTYIAQVGSGAVALHFPIHPDYRWVYTMLIGTGVKGGQDEANIGNLFVDPKPKVLTQAEAEKAALKALKDGKSGTYVAFELKQKDTVRFWVSDYDYSDNSGSERVRIYTVDKTASKNNKKGEM